MSKAGTLARVIGKMDNWPTYLVDYLKLAKPGIVQYVFRNGIRLELRSGTYDRVAVGDVWFREYYTPDGFAIKEGDIVVDIGAHIGSFSVYAAAIAKKGRVIAYEPMPENFQLLKRNIELNELGNVTAIRKAVSDRSGNKTLHIANGNTCGHSFYTKLLDSTDKELTVDTVSLEDAMRENRLDRIDFLKIDCEGGEYEILLGAPRRVLEKIGKLAVEYHELDSKRNLASLKKFLESNGFETTCPDSRPVGMMYAKRRS